MRAGPSFPKEGPAQLLPHALNAVCKVILNKYIEKASNKYHRNVRINRENLKNLV